MVKKDFWHIFYKKQNAHRKGQTYGFTRGLELNLHYIYTNNE